MKRKPGEIMILEAHESLECINLGLSRREHFAGLAMQGMLVAYPTADKFEIASMSARQADALIAELDESAK
jgi:hypothetical protein